MSAHGMKACDIDPYAQPAALAAGACVAKAVTATTVTTATGASVRESFLQSSIHPPFVAFVVVALPCGDDRIEGGGEPRHIPRRGEGGANPSREGIAWAC